MVPPFSKSCYNKVKSLIRSFDPPVMKPKLSEASDASMRDVLAALRIELVASLRAKPAVCRLDAPLQPSRARSLGYKALPGYAVILSRVPRGGRRKPRPNSGRRSKHAGSVLFTPGISRGEIAVGRAHKKFENMDVLGYHEVAGDGKYHWFEVIMVDRTKRS
jgi:large subunit ribosomal protein L15e